jgi:hypothetical protein
MLCAPGRDGPHGPDQSYLHRAAMALITAERWKWRSNESESQRSALCSIDLPAPAQAFR